MVLDGYYGDSAITVPVGAISESAQRLLKVTEEALELALEKVRLGNRLGDVSATVQQHAEKNGYSVVREFVGHGIGKAMHEEPQIPNFGQAGHGPLLKEGMVFAIEPMVNAGGPAVRVLDDNWTAVTVDGRLSAHFEHMVAVTQNGPDVLTRLVVVSRAAPWLRWTRAPGLRPREKYGEGRCNRGYGDGAGSIAQCDVSS